jgi:hypothetical protein
MTTPSKVAVGAALALAAVIGAGDHGAADTFEAIEITVAVVIVLAVAGLLAALILHRRNSRPMYRPDLAIMRGRVRAEVISIRTPLPLAGAESNGAGRSRPEPADVQPGDGRRYALPLALAAGGALSGRARPPERVT